jgi:hypothetical protein
VICSKDATSSLQYELRTLTSTMVALGMSLAVIEITVGSTVNAAIMRMLSYASRMSPN